MAQADFVIVGAGIAGSSCARIAQHYGYTTLLIDADLPNSASRAALAVVNPHWHKGRGRKLTMRSLEWYHRWGALVDVAPDVENLPQNVKKPPLYLIEPQFCLTHPNIHATINTLRFDGVIDDLGAFYKATRAVICCVGAFAGHFGIQYSKKTYGATYWGVGNGDNVLRSVRLTPYQDFHEASTAEGRRVGSSAAMSQQDAKARLVKMAEKANMRPCSDIRVGLRGYINDGTHIANEYTPHKIGGVWYMVGFGKVGYALAPAIAEEIIRGL